MRVFIIITSALQYWRSHAALDRDRIVPTRAKPQPIDVPNAIDAGDLIDSSGYGLTAPVNFMVAGKEQCRKSEHAKCWVTPESLPSGSFVRIGRYCYVACPELMFVQMANTLSLVALVELGYELCGSYVLDPADPWGFRKREPLTGVARLKAFVAKADKVRGVKRARQALRHIIDNSASPRETHLAMLLTLPCSMGGYGLVKPLMNYRYVFPATQQRLAGKNHYVCDLCWSGEHLALEYDSDQFHSSPDRVSGDAKRRADLALLGIEVISVTNADIQSAVRMEKIARLVAKRTGKRIRKSEFDLTWQRIELRETLLRQRSSRDLCVEPGC